MEEQLYYIISKIELIDNVIVETYVGYTTSEQDANTINFNYNSTLGDWIFTNREDLISNTKSMSEFFQTIPYVHSAGLSTTCIEGLDLQPITLDQL